jgi:hypothetical protein
MVVGKLVQSAALGIKQTLISSNLLSESYTAEEFRAACQHYVAEHSQFRSWSRYEAPERIFWDDQKYRGEAYAAFAWAVYIAEVTVDLATYRVVGGRLRRAPGSWQGSASTSGKRANHRWRCPRNRIQPL